MRQRIAWLIMGSALVLAFAAAAAGAQPASSQSNPLFLPALRQAEPTPTATATSEPTATATGEPAPSPTATATTTPPAAVTVRSHRNYSEGSFLYVVGEVLNGTGQSVYFAKIEARFYNAADQLVATESAFTSLTETEPSQRNPFKLLLSNPPADIARYELGVTWLDDGVLDYRPITVLSHQTRDNFGVEVFGEVRNDQPGEMRSARVAVAFYDAAGEVVDTDYGFPSSTTLAPGATSVYSVKTFSDIAFVSMAVQAEGYLAP